MSWDLVGAIAFLVGLSGLTFWLGLSFAPRALTVVLCCTTAAVALFIVLFAVTLHGSLIVALIVPLANALIVGNATAPGGAFLSGIVAGHRSIPYWRRTTFALALLAVAWFTVLDDFVGGIPATQPCLPVRGVYLQTSAASCGPCCAATLLNHEGVVSDEQEMMELCLTHDHGTPWLGLYRGLKLKTRNTALDVKVVRGTLDDLRRQTTSPVLLRLRPERSRWTFLTGNGDPDWSEPPDSDHAVVLFGFTRDGRAEIGDPADDRGRTLWTVDELLRRWGGLGLQLVSRTRGAATAR